MIKVLIPRDKFEDLLTPECVEWIRSRPEGVPEAGNEGTQLWLRFSDPAAAADFEQLWLGKKLPSKADDLGSQSTRGRAA